MSMDKTVVLAGRLNRESDEMEYAVAAVGAAENLVDTHNYQDALDLSRQIFHQAGVLWFKKLDRARQLAVLVLQEGLETGDVEYDEVMFIEMGRRRVYRLSEDGKRI